MAQTVAVGEFEGPLGLLLELVERGKLEVSQLSVGEITAGYLARLRELKGQSPEDVSEFLGLGARLLYIKSLALLPQAPVPEQTEELHKLNLELEEYRRLRAAAGELARCAPTRTWTRTATETFAPDDVPPPTFELSQLAQVFQQALRRVEPARPTGVLRRRLSLETVVQTLRKRLERGQVGLQELVDNCRDRLEIIVTFLAILELVRGGTAQVSQPSQFAPIMVEATHG